MRKGLTSIPLHLVLLKPLPAYWPMRSISPRIFTPLVMLVLASAFLTNRPAAGAGRGQQG